MVLKGGICLCKKVKILEWKKVSLLILQLLFLVMKSTEMKELFRDDKIYGIVESDSEMSKFISMFEDSEDIYEGKERAVGTLQVAAGRHGDHEHKLGEVAEQKPIQEMDIHYDAGFSVPQFSRCGDCKSEEIQELDAVLIQDNKFSDVKEETGKVIPQVFAEQCNNHKQRMVEEVPKSAYTPVSDENTYANSALKKDDSRSADDKSAERIENVRKIDAESSSKDINFDSERQCSFDPLPVAISKNIDASEDVASDMNVASPMFTSFEMKEFFHDDNIDGILISDPVMSNVNSL